MAELLVSVRSVEEAQAALAGGAALIDVKEPAHGSLGRADDSTIAAVVRFSAGRRPVSAALGELSKPLSLPRPGLAFVKWGLANLGRQPGWQQALASAIQEVEQIDSACRVVTVAYADEDRSQAPPVEEVLSFAVQRPGSVLLLDTFSKVRGRSLLDWLPLPRIVSCAGAAVMPE